MNSFFTDPINYIAIALLCLIVVVWTQRQQIISINNFLKKTFKSDITDFFSRTKELISESVRVSIDFCKHESLEIEFLKEKINKLENRIAELEKNFSKKEEIKND